MPGPGWIQFAGRRSQTPALPLPCPAAQIGRRHPFARAMKLHQPILAAASLLLLAATSHAATNVTVAHGDGVPGFNLKPVPPPANNDAATTATFTLVDGARDPNGGELAVLHDGRVPTGEDQPADNFFFRAGTDGGRIQIDLGKVISVKQVNTYSWHAGTRGPQVFKLYASDGAAGGFNPAPKKGTDPLTCGWKLVASVDTRPKDGDGGGQHAVSISDTDGALGKFRHLLLDISQTESRDAFGNTFFGEIDVIDSDGPAPTSGGFTDDTPILKTFATADGDYQFTINATAAPDLADWAEKELNPVVKEWYPKLVAMLPSEGVRAPTNVTLRFRMDMGGTPASASGAGVNLNTQWFRRELQREARGAVVHELVHVVQSYGRTRRTNPDAVRTPGWLVEGIPDYIRWFLYEPQTKGAEITARNLANARYDASYRVTGNFLDWVTRTHDKEFIRKMNAAARQGNYSEKLWKDWTGKTMQELGDEWKKAHEARLNAATPAPAK